MHNNPDLPRVIFCARELTPATVETFAALGEKPPAPAPLSGVAMAYSLIRNNGERETGRVLLLGDVAHNRGRLRLEADCGDSIESAQTEWADAFSPERRAVVRNFLNMCAGIRASKRNWKRACKPVESRLPRVSGLAHEVNISARMLEFQPDLPY